MDTQQNPAQPQRPAPPTTDAQSFLDVFLQDLHPTGPSLDINSLFLGADPTGALALPAQGQATFYRSGGAMPQHNQPGLQQPPHRYATQQPGGWDVNTAGGYHGLMQSRPAGNMPNMGLTGGPQGTPGSAHAQETSGEAQQSVVGQKRSLSQDSEGDGEHSTDRANSNAEDNARSKRMERKRHTEKIRRQELNERLDEMAQVLDLVELHSGPSDPVNQAKADKNKEHHRVHLLSRCINCLKNLRHAYDCRTAEVMKLALKMQHHASAPGAYLAPDQAAAGAAAAAPGSGTAMEPSQDSSSSSSSSSHPTGEAVTSGDLIKPNVSTSMPSSVPTPPAVSSSIASSPTVRGMPVQASLPQTTNGMPTVSSDAQSQDFVPMMMMMPIWVPRGSKPPAPQLAPISAELASVFNADAVPVPVPATASRSSNFTAPPIPPVSSPRPGALPGMHQAVPLQAPSAMGFVPGQSGQGQDMSFSAGPPMGVNPRQPAMSAATAGASMGSSTGDSGGPQGAGRGQVIAAMARCA